MTDPGRSAATDTFPRQQARTRRFTLGLPRTFTVSPDGARVLFLRSAGGADPTTALWQQLVGSGEERMVADPARLGAAGEPTAEERARRERMREQAGGIVAYSTDRAAVQAAFTVGGDLWAVDVASGEAVALDVTGPVFDPRLDPTGQHVAWCCGSDLRVAGVDGTGEAVLAAAEGPDVTWGQAEFVAAEEMDRDRGHWWAPDGRGLLATRVDVGPVGTWWVTDPAFPDRAPVPYRYPAAGTADADVQLWWLGLDGERREIVWDRERYPYLPVVTWAGDRPLIVVEHRDHRVCEVLDVDVATGATKVEARTEDPGWVRWPAGAPARLGDGRLVWGVEEDDTDRLTVGGHPVTPAGLQVRRVVVGDDDVVFTASGQDPTSIELWRWWDGGLEQLAAGGVVRAVAAAGGTIVALEGRADGPPMVSVRRVGAASAGIGPIRSLAERPLLSPTVHRLTVGERRLPVGVVLPTGHRPGDRWPVLMYPYGGPSAQMVMNDQRLWLEAQWRADQGFAVLVADGRGVPGRGPAWEREVHGDFATPVLQDQVDALHGAAAEIDALDLSRVGITGWSFGGYLAAMAVLRRPDVFHAAVAGAPVTDFALYDTYYTERYLGHPATAPDAYRVTSLLDDAPGLRRPLLLVHGLVDDNVYVAHTLRLSQRLLQAGRAHSVLPLTGMTHMASGEEVAEHLLGLQMRFLADALGATPPAG